MRQLKIELSPNGIDDAINWLEEYAKLINKRMDFACKDLANLVKNEAQTGYNSSSQNRVFVDVKKTGDGEYSVRAEGEPAIGSDGQVHGNTVIFAEFGVGVYAGNGHPLAAEYGAEPASWSSTYGTGQLAHTMMLGDPWWRYKGQLFYDGYEGTKAMYNASQTARQNVKKIFSEVFY